MRHSFLPRPPAAHPGGMHLPATKARLIASDGGAQVLPARSCATLARAVDLAAVTTAADDHLTAATRAQKQPALPRRHGVDERPQRQDTGPAFVPGTVWGTASMQNLVVGLGAVLALNPGRPAPRRLPSPAVAPSPPQEPASSAIHPRYPSTPGRAQFEIARKPPAAGFTRLLTAIDSGR